MSLALSVVISCQQLTVCEVYVRVWCVSGDSLGLVLRSILSHNKEIMISPRTAYLYLITLPHSLSSPSPSLSLSSSPLSLSLLSLLEVILASVRLLQ